MIQFNPDNVFLVTGASSGLGKAIALKIIALGGSVIAVSRNSDKLNLSRNEAIEPERFFIEPFDLSASLEEIPDFIKQCAKKYGKLAGLVHSAGIGGVTPLKVLDLSEAKSMFDINYFGALMLTKGFCDKRICTANASVVILSSIAAIQGNSGLGNYSATKGAVNSLVQSLAVETAKQNIRINAISPGFIVTEIIQHAPNVYNDEFFTKIKEEYPLGEGHPEDVASACIFLLSHSARWITGQNIIIDGGRTLL
ncbi:SDR family NAD(P)-dependent oxidoreductase [Sulfuricurvum sp.]|uniref:SDR family NAD(P)-dependent oxidoreductase n=1 Tax=Sulfuricurvum sp. TaxID=2025608 RepID=UPI003BB78CDF